MTLYPGVAIVTGAASGIGRQTAVSFAVEGCKKIAIADLNVAGLKETEKLIKDVASDCAVLTLSVNMKDEKGVQTMISLTVKEFGRIDYAINAAGIIGNNERSTDTSIDEFENINNINYRGCWLSSRAELQQMLQQEPQPTHDGRPGEKGSIVNIASQLGIVSRPKAAAYCASKAAVISMTKSDAIDYSEENIRVNCVCPGIIATPMTTGTSDFSERIKDSVNIAPMKRMGTAQEIADACLFLCSTKASFVQGAALVVDGGYTIN